MKIGTSDICYMGILDVNMRVNNALFFSCKLYSVILYMFNTRELYYLPAQDSKMIEKFQMESQNVRGKREKFSSRWINRRFAMLELPDN